MPSHKIKTTHRYKKQFKVCIFCWKHVDHRSDDIVSTESFFYGNRVYVVHEACVQWWYICHPLIRDGRLHSNLKYERNDAEMYCLFVEDFFKHLKRVDPEALTGLNSDYFLYYD